MNNQSTNHSNQGGSQEQQKEKLRSATSTQGRLMAGARALWHANGMTREQMGKPIIAIANSLHSLCRDICICTMLDSW